MALSPGTRLGPYEILASLGVGGMGEVYRARDTKLARDIALKVLLDGVATDRERLLRFGLEARTASGLNHPNIITIHDIDTTGSTAYIAMELVDGRTLRELLASGPLSVRKILEIAAQTADGLAKAHAAGIVHRDLKPENLMVTKDGFVKILDFGLAKLTAAGELTDRSMADTLVQQTTPGTVLGTVGYMSPEQAAGKPLDFRSDQFSFGSALYEMATGRRPFGRATAAQTMAAIIQDEPEPIAQYNAKIPAPLRWSIDRCLAKDPDGRYASTRDLARELAMLRDHLSEAVSTSSELVAHGPAPRIGRMRVAVAIALLASWAALFMAGERAVKPPIPTFQRVTFRHGTVGRARFAPDAKTVVYSARWDGAPPELFTMRVESPESRLLGIADSHLLSVSSAGELAIAQKGARDRHDVLAQLSLGGGAPRTLLEDVTAADWTPDGKQLAVVRARNRVELLPGKLIYLSKGYVFDLRVSRSGGEVGLIEVDRDGSPSILVLDLQGKTKVVTGGWTDASGLAWAPKGDELWFTASKVGSTLALHAVSLSGRVRRVAGMPGTVEIKDISPDGRVLLSRDTYDSQIAGLFPGETVERNFSWLDKPWGLDLSADGKTLLFSETGDAAGPGGSVYLRKTDGTPAVRLGEGKAMALSPDGKWALAEPPSANGPRLLLLPTGAGEPRTLSLEPVTERTAVCWFPGGKQFTVSGTEPGHKARCYAVDVESGKARPITPEGIRGLEGQAAVSPDGRRLLVTDARDENKKPMPIGIYSLDDGKLQLLKGLEDTDKDWKWSADGLALLAHQHERDSTKLVRFDLNRGVREVVRQLTLADRAGLMAPPEPVVSADEKWYAYTYWRDLSDLYIADGLK